MTDSSTQTYYLIFRKQIEQYYIQKIEADCIEGAHTIADMMAEDHMDGDIVLPFSPAKEEITVIVGRDQKKEDE